MQLLKEFLPKDNIVLDSYYQTKKLVHSLGLPVERLIVVNQDVYCIRVMINTLHFLNFVDKIDKSVVLALVRGN